MLKRIVGVAVVAVLLGGIYTWARSAARLEGSASGQIRGAILTAFQAANQGHMSQAMDVISPDYKDSTGLNRDHLWILLRRAAANKRYWSVAARRIAPTAEGREASVDVDASVNTEGDTAQRLIPLKLTMRLEDTHVWGVIPTQRWRIVSAEGLPDELLSLGE